MKHQHVTEAYFAFLQRIERYRELQSHSESTHVKGEEKKKEKTINKSNSFSPLKLQTNNSHHRGKNRAKFVPSSKQRFWKRRLFLITPKLSYYSDDNYSGVLKFWDLHLTCWFLLQGFVRQQTVLCVQAGVDETSTFAIPLDFFFRRFLCFSLNRNCDFMLFSHSFLCLLQINIAARASSI